MTVTLTFSDPAPAVIPQDTAVWLVRCRAQVTPDTHGPSDNNVFVLKKAGNVHTFAAVASVQQLLQLPPVPGDNESPFVRWHEVVLLCYTADEAATARERIAADVRMLVSDWAKIHSFSSGSQVSVSSQTTDLGSVSWDALSNIPAGLCTSSPSEDGLYLEFRDMDGNLIGKSLINT